MSEDGEHVLPSGLVIPNSGRLQVPGTQIEPIAGTTLVVPGTTDTLLLPKKKKFELLTDEELRTQVQAQSAEAGQPNKRRSHGEIALALHNPTLFIQKEIDQDPSFGTSAYCRETLSLIASPETVHFHSPQSLHSILVRLNEQVDIRYDTVKALETSSPGTMEQVLLKIADLLDEKALQNPQIAYYLVQLPSKCVQVIRQQLDMLEAPEMPDLAEKLLSTVGHFDKYPGIRHAIFDLLSQTQIPNSLLELWLHKMQQCKDLQHPFANKLLYQLYEFNPEAAFIQEQRTRVHELRSAMGSDPQILFDNYEELRKRLKDIVTTCLPDEITSGKVGFEIEYRKTAHANPPDKSRWDYMRGAQYSEIRIQNIDNLLERNTGHAANLIELSTYLNDNAQFIGTTHLHFDLQKHPHSPGLLGLLPFSSHGMTGITKNRNHPTWELRGIKPPVLATSLSATNAEQQRRYTTINPAKYNELIELFSRITQTPQHQTEKLRIAPTSTVSVSQVIFGHIAALYDDPQIRLLALSVTDEAHMLSAWNPLALKNTFMHSSLVYISELGQSDKSGPETVQNAQELLKHLSEQSPFMSDIYRLTGAHEYVRIAEKISHENADTVYSLFSGPMYFFATDISPYLDEELLVQVAEKFISSGTGRQEWYCIYAKQIMKQDQKPSDRLVIKLLNNLPRFHEGQKLIREMVIHPPKWVEIDRLARTLTNMVSFRNDDSLNIYRQILEEGITDIPEFIAAAKIGKMIDQYTDPRQSESISTQAVLPELATELITHAHLVTDSELMHTFLMSLQHATNFDQDDQLKNLAFAKLVEIFTDDPYVVAVPDILKYINPTTEPSAVLKFLSQIKKNDRDGRASYSLLFNIANNERFSPTIREAAMIRSRNLW